MTALRFDDVSKSFDGRPVLDGLNVSIEAGQIVGLIGDNGAGKTTFLRLAARILTPTAGRVVVFGAEDPLMIRRRLGASLERPGHYDELTVSENLRFFYSFYADAKAPVDDLVRASLEQFQLASVGDRAVGRLSTGNRQRLAIARALHPWADLVLLDEPLESLDPIARAQAKQHFLASKAEGRTLIISSHTLSDLAQICDRLILIADGHTREFPSFDAIRAMLGADESAVDLDVLYARMRQRQIADRGVH